MQTGLLASVARDPHTGAPAKNPAHALALGAASALPGYIEGKAKDRKQTAEEQKAIANVAVTLEQIKSTESIAEMEAINNIQKQYNTQAWLDQKSEEARGLLEDYGGSYIGGTIPGVGVEGKVYTDEFQLGGDMHGEFVRQQVAAKIEALTGGNKLAETEFGPEWKYEEVTPS